MTLQGRGGTAFPGVLFSSGQTWEEQRRFTLKTLRDLGFGKGLSEEMLRDDVSEAAKKNRQNFCFIFLSKKMR